MADPSSYILESPPGREVFINGRKYLYFAGTGYFELHNHPELIEAANRACTALGTAPATSRVVAGTTPLLREIEEKISAFFATETAAYLPSGYLSSFAGLSALLEMDRFEKIFADEGSHYSLLEAVRATGKPCILYESGDLDDLKRKLEQHLAGNERPLIASDGLFPVQARLAPLPGMVEAADSCNGIIWIDDAHGVGILGDRGRGTAEHFGIRSDRLFMGATLSKAFGSYGGMIPGTREFISRVLQGNIVSGCSSPMNAAVAAGIRGLEMVRDHPGWREQLWKNAAYLKKGLKSLRVPVEENGLPIASFPAGDRAAMSGLQRALMDEGIYIQYTRYHGSGPEGVLRIVVFSTHTREQIDALIHALGRHLPRS